MHFFFRNLDFYIKTCMYIHSRFSKIKITKKSNNSKELSLKSQRQIPVFKHLMINSIGLGLSPKNATCILKI